MSSTPFNPSFSDNHARLAKPEFNVSFFFFFCYGPAPFCFIIYHHKIEIGIYFSI